MGFVNLHFCGVKFKGTVFTSELSADSQKVSSLFL